MWLIRALLSVFFTVSSQAATVKGLYYDTFGDPSKPALVFLHGGPGYNSFSFEYGIGQKIADAGYYVVVFDQRNAGRSASGVTADFTFANATQDILDVIEASHASNPILLAHSWGGALGIEFLKLHPESAKGLVMFEAPINYPVGVYWTLVNSAEAFHRANRPDDEKTVRDRMSRMYPALRAIRK